MIEKIRKHLDSYDFDIRKTGNARFMDQKVTPDVLSFIADCVLVFTLGEASSEFTIKDIWNSQYFMKLVQQVFSKPVPKDETAVHEYDKFIGQPIKALEYAKILSVDNSGRSAKFIIHNKEVLQYIASNSRNAFNFLSLYLEKVMRDSEFYADIAHYEDLYRKGALGPSEFLEFKNKFQKLIIGNTKINGTTEVNRIFPKIINILAVDKCMPGTEAGRMSKHPFYYQDLMYNRINFRDKDKEKSVTRASAAEEAPAESSGAYADQRLKNQVNDMHATSEVPDSLGKGPADHIHHIFPRNEFPELRPYPENLIKLTASQHLSKAHPGGDTHVVDREYQKICLISKSISIENSLKRHQYFYRKESLVNVVNVGYSWSLPFLISFDSLRQQISKK